MFRKPPGSVPGQPCIQAQEFSGNLPGDVPDMFRHSHVKGILSVRSPSHKQVKNSTTTSEEEESNKKKRKDGRSAQGPWGSSVLRCLRRTRERPLVRKARRRTSVAVARTVQAPRP